MRVSRIYTEQPLATDQRVELDSRAGRYVRQVLRLRAGQSCVLFNGDGNDYEAELTRCDNRHCEARIGGLLGSEAPTHLRLQLGLGISRGERMDLAIQKSVELGVQAISPLMTERSVVRLSDDRLEKRLAHWRGVVISACEQSGRSLLPVLDAPLRLDNWLALRRDGLMLYHRATRTLADLPAPGESLNLLIGPEGGLSAVERERATSAGFRDVRLGPRVLRTETAPIAALAAIQMLWGDFR